MNKKNIHVHYFIDKKPIKDKKGRLIGFNDKCKNCQAQRVVKDGNACIIYDYRGSEFK